MKKRTLGQITKDYFDAYKAIREDRPVKRQGAKDGSVPTHPIIAVPHLSEAEVLKSCMKWLRKQGILCNRNNVGSGQMGESGYYSYGIRNAGDIIGLLKTGQHFEIECKRGQGGRLSSGQQKRKRDIEATNGIYLVVHGVNELEFYFGSLV